MAQTTPRPRPACADVCGIAGIFHYRDARRDADAAIVSVMTDALAHRGPDGRGVHCDGPAGLGHRRLAILDPTDRGAQPLTSSSGRCTISYNGEIYNFRDLRSRLEARGHRFRTQTDTEALLLAYEEWGAGAVAELNGIFAFAVWDARARTLCLARDRFGVKPLYIQDDGSTMRFASEIKAILADASVERTPAWNGIRSVLALGYAAAPHTCFEGVRQLEPGRVRIYDDSGPRESAFWRFSLPAPVSIGAAEAGEQFDALLDRATARQMVSDVPIGAFLSGGLDSTRVVEAMRRETAGTIRAFTVGFGGTEFDESPVAVQTASRLGLEHHVEHVEIDLVDTVCDVAARCDDPFADSSALAMYHLCRVTARDVKVALAGDGADELLAGYATYGAEPFAAPLRALPRWLSGGVLRRIADRVPVQDRPYSLRQVSRRLLLAGVEPPARAHASWRRCLFDEDERTLLTDAAFDASRAAEDPIAQYAAEYDRCADGTAALRRMMAADLLFHLPNDMLVKVDRMSMASGLEVRVPMLDNDFVDFTLGLPPDLVRGGSEKGKRLLKQSLSRRLPGFGVNRRKQGLLVPIAQGLRSKLGDLLCEAVTDGTPFQPQAVRGMLQRHRDRRIDASFELYAVLMVSLWWNRFFA
jgi:asparagine synthase (glutamine-hydrolysing)